MLIRFILTLFFTSLVKNTAFSDKENRKSVNTVLKDHIEADIQDLNDSSFESLSSYDDFVGVAVIVLFSVAFLAIVITKNPGYFSNFVNILSSFFIAPGGDTDINSANNINEASNSKGSTFFYRMPDYFINNVPDAFNYIKLESRTFFEWIFPTISGLALNTDYISVMNSSEIFEAINALNSLYGHTTLNEASFLNSSFVKLLYIYKMSSFQNLPILYRVMIASCESATPLTLNQPLIYGEKLLDPTLENYNMKQLASICMICSTEYLKKSITDSQN